MSDTQHLTYYRLKIEQLMTLLGTSEQGLSLAEADERLKHVGVNELETKTLVNPILIFINQFKSFIIYILLLPCCSRLLSENILIRPSF